MNKEHAADRVKAHCDDGPLRAFFFDLDGTLMATAPDVGAALNEVLGAHDLPLLSPREVEHKISGGTVQLLGPQALHLKRAFLHCYAQRVSGNCNTAFFPDIVPLLRALKERNIICGIVTNKPEYLCRPLLRHHNAESWFDVLVCPEHVSHPKPDPESLLLACHRTGCIPQHAVYAGDHERDMLAGRRAGMLTVAAAYGYVQPDDNPDAWQASFVARQPGDIMRWLHRGHWRLRALMNTSVMKQVDEPDR